MTRKLATVSRLPSGAGRGRPKTRLAGAVDGSERELLVVWRRTLAAGLISALRWAAVAALIRQSATSTRRFGRLTRLPRTSSSSGRRCTGGAQRRAATHRSSESMVSMSRMRGGYSRTVL